MLGSTSAVEVEFKSPQNWPLMYAIGRRAESPQVHFPTTTAAAPSHPQRELESKLESHPFLQSLPVYRYTLLAGGNPVPRT
jgi:hypothetical protein